MHSTASGNGDRRLQLLAQIEQWQALIQIPENVELRQNKYLNNLALAGPSLYQAINTHPAWDSTRSIQRSRTLRGFEAMNMLRTRTREKPAQNEQA